MVFLLFCDELLLLTCMLVYLSRYPVDQTLVSVSTFTDMIFNHFTGAYLSHSESSRNLRNKKPHELQGEKFHLSLHIVLRENNMKCPCKNWVTQIIVSCVINHKMLWDSAHKSCHGPKGRLDANCFEKCCCLLTRLLSIHQSACSLERSSCLPQLYFPQ